MWQEEVCVEERNQEMKFNNVSYNYSTYLISTFGTKMKKRNIDVAIKIPPENSTSVTMMYAFIEKVTTPRTSTTKLVE